RKKIPTSSSAWRPRTSCPAITYGIVEFDRPGSPVPLSCASVCLDNRAVIKLGITKHVASASFGVHVSTSFDHIEDYIVFYKEKFVAAPMSVFRPRTVAVLMAIVIGHSHCAE